MSMKKLLVFCLLVALKTAVHAQQAPYNKSLADSLGGDDYGMKMYTLVILKTGSVMITDKSKTDSLFRVHMDNIGRLAKEGKLVVAGPLQKNDKAYRGIFILNVSPAEAPALLESDPAIKAKLLETEIFGWYGSAALPMYLRYHDEIERKKP